MLGARREDRLQTLVKDIEESNGQAVYTVTDVNRPEDVQQLAKKAIDSYGSIDVWINNAGSMPQSTFDQGRVDDWNQMIDVNIKGVLYGINAALPTMREQKSGHFINVASIAAHIVGSGSSVYSATKAAVWMISEGLRQEKAIAGSNVRVTVLSPGAIATELPQHITDEETKKGTLQFYDLMAIQPDRIARAVAFAIDEPDDTGINEIIIRPSKQQM